eukprot:gene5900-gene4298
MASTLAIPPMPISPHARRFRTGHTTWNILSFNVSGRAEAGLVTGLWAGPVQKFESSSGVVWPGTPYQFWRVSICCLVMGCVHMAVFIAGQMMTGFCFTSHARMTHVTRLSHKPPAILAREFASSGATSTTSAHRRSSMCTTASLTTSHWRHSSSS